MDDDVLANMSERRRLSCRASLFFLLELLPVEVVAVASLPVLIGLCLRRRGWASPASCDGLLGSTGSDEDEEGGGTVTMGVDDVCCCSCFCATACNRAMAVQHGGHANFIWTVE